MCTEPSIPFLLRATEYMQGLRPNIRRRTYKPGPDTSSREAARSPASPPKTIEVKDMWPRGVFSFTVLLGRITRAAVGSVFAPGPSEDKRRKASKGRTLKSRLSLQPAVGLRLNSGSPRLNFA